MQPMLSNLCTTYQAYLKKSFTTFPVAMLRVCPSPWRESLSAPENRVDGESGEGLVRSDLFIRMGVFAGGPVRQSQVKELWEDADSDDVSRVIDKLVDVNLLSEKPSTAECLCG